MSDFVNSISETLDKIGQNFLMGYYLPSITFVLLNFFIIVPIWIGQPVNFSPTIISFGGTFDLDDILVTIGLLILMPVIIGMILVSLNTILIRLFEGKVWWLGHGLVYPFLRINRTRNETLYGNLVKLRKAYAQLSREVVTEPNRKEEIFQHLDALSHQIESEHEKIEKSQNPHELPVDAHRITPTLLGNVYAQIEEYAYQTYGMDSVLFWPRLRILMIKTCPELSEHITRQKVIFDLSLNFAVLSGIIFLEGLGLLLLGTSGRTSIALVIALSGLLGFWAFYQSMVAGIRSLGESIKLSFDLYRHLIFDALEIDRPKTLLEEKVLWVQLAAFLRRGEDFYFPARRHA